MPVLLCLAFTTSACTRAPHALRTGNAAPLDAAPPDVTTTAAPGQSLRPAPVRQAGVIADPELPEISGMAVSRRSANVLWVINDGGNPATLYALSHTGEPLGRFPVNARNRDWEDLASVRWNDEAWLLIADIGDNGARHERSAIHLLREPLPEAAGQTLTPALTLEFSYDDGPHDAESLAVTDDALLILTKQAVRNGTRQPSAIYTLPRPSAESLYTSTRAAAQAPLTASRQGSMTLPAMNLEARLIAALAGVDVHQPTAIDIRDDTAYVLTYRTIRRYRRQPGQTWPDALQGPGKRVVTHSLRQAEALAAAENGTIWFTTESLDPGLWMWQDATRRSARRQSPPM